MDGTDSQHRALEVGRRLLQAVSGAPPSAGVRVAPPPAPVRTIASVRLGTRGAAPHPSDDEYDQELERLQGRLARLQVLRTLGDCIDAALD